MTIRMIKYLFNKYTAISIGVQFLAVISIWGLAFAISPAGDKLFGLMFYFYYPTIFLVSTALGLRGESGMIAAGIYGIGVGILLYGLIFGFALAIIQRGR
jgi:hypothetical protein